MRLAFSFSDTNCCPSLSSISLGLVKIRSNLQFFCFSTILAIDSNCLNSCLSSREEIFISAITLSFSLIAIKSGLKLPKKSGVSNIEGSIRTSYPLDL
ncbi:hypothetical protein D3C87_1665360 [compost metagenome]